MGNCRQATLQAAWRIHEQRENQTEDCDTAVHPCMPETHSTGASVTNRRSNCNEVESASNFGKAQIACETSMDQHTKSRIAAADAQLQHGKSLHPFFMNPSQRALRKRSGDHDHSNATRSAEPIDPPWPPLPQHVQSSSDGAVSNQSSPDTAMLCVHEPRSRFAQQANQHSCWSESHLLSRCTSKSTHADLPIREHTVESVNANTFNNASCSRRSASAPLDQLTQEAATLECRNMHQLLKRLHEIRNANERSDDCAVHRMWTHRYAPRCANDVCTSSTVAMSSLKAWLHQWTLQTHEDCSNHNAKARRRTTRKQRCISRESDSDFASSGDEEIAALDNELDGDKSIDSEARAVLLHGAPGSGKSAAIYACAAELGLRVLEVNGSEKRNGSNVTAKFSEASKSKRILCTTDSSEIDRLGTRHAQGKKKRRTNETADDNANHFNASDLQLGDDTLLLFEEVDTADEDDRGFYAAIASIATSSKRPVVLTANAPLPDGTFESLELVQMKVDRPTEANLVQLLAAIARTEEKYAQLSELKTLVHHCKDDVRRAILWLQLMLCGEGSSHHPRDLVSDMETLAHVHAPNVLAEGEVTGEYGSYSESSTRLYLKANEQISADRSIQCMRDAEEKAKKLHQEKNALHDGGKQDRALRRLEQAVPPQARFSHLQSSCSHRGDTVSNAIQCVEKINNVESDGEKRRQALQRFEPHAPSTPCTAGYNALGKARTLTSHLSACDVLYSRKWCTVQDHMPGVGNQVLNDDDADEEGEPSGGDPEWGMHAGVAANCAKWLADAHLHSLQQICTAKNISTASEKRSMLPCRVIGKTAAGSISVLRGFASYAVGHAHISSVAESLELATVTAKVAELERQKHKGARGRTRRSLQRLPVPHSVTDALIHQLSFSDAPNA